MQIALSVYPIPQPERGELSESFGTLRYGDLLEVLLYDVRHSQCGRSELGVSGSNR